MGRLDDSLRQGCRCPKLPRRDPGGRRSLCLAAGQLIWKQQPVPSACAYQEGIERFELVRCRGRSRSYPTFQPTQIIGPAHPGSLVPCSSCCSPWATAPTTTSNQPSRRARVGREKYLPTPTKPPKRHHCAFVRPARKVNRRSPSASSRPPAFAQAPGRPVLLRKTSCCPVSDCVARTQPGREQIDVRVHSAGSVRSRASSIHWPSVSRSLK